MPVARRLGETPEMVPFTLVPIGKVDHAFHSQKTASQCNPCDPRLSSIRLSVVRTGTPSGGSFKPRIYRRLAHRRIPEFLAAGVATRARLCRYSGGSSQDTVRLAAYRFSRCT